MGNLPHALVRGVKRFLCSPVVSPADAAHRSHGVSAFACEAATLEPWLWSATIAAPRSVSNYRREVVISGPSARGMPLQNTLG